jgi:hypothetical protein
MNIDSVTAKFTEGQLRDAFMCGVVCGRIDKSPVEIDEEEERCKVEDQYGDFWPGELLLAGFCEYPEGPVGKLEHASYMEHHKPSQLARQLFDSLLPIAKGDPQ